MMMLVLATLLTGPGDDAFLSKKEQDIAAINAMCGCYEVTFEYAETFASDENYERHDNYKATALEWVEADRVSENEFALQHLLLVNDSTVIKHWRQDWLYQATARYKFVKDLTWTFEKQPDEEVTGQWMQKVYQVDDGPRYEGVASWVHVDGKSYWESEVDAPLPRREYTKRDDYNVMKRQNRHEITDYGWLHEQDNMKILRRAGQDSVLVSEKGYNTYKKVADEKCQAAQTWWAENGDFWRVVRQAWDEVYARQTGFSLSKKVDGSHLSKKLFDLSEKTSPDTDKAALKADILKLIEMHITTDTALESGATENSSY